MVTDSGAVVGFATRPVLADLPGEVPWLVLDDESDIEGVQGGVVVDDERVRSLQYAHPAYVIYTSVRRANPRASP